MQQLLGDVNVANQPVVEAKQSGEWNVTINNSPSNPVPVVEERRITPVQASEQTDACGTGCEVIPYTVPDGYR